MTTQSYDTRVGKLTFTHNFANGYPTDETVVKLYDERDFQRACQAYVWALPIVSFAQWQHEHNATLGAKNGQIVFVESYKDKLGGLTYQTTTPYCLPFVDLSEGPFVAEIPEGEVRGAAHHLVEGDALHPHLEPVAALPHPRLHQHDISLLPEVARRLIEVGPDRHLHRAR